MFSMETTLMGIALALDAAVVSFAIGLVHFELPHWHKLSRGLIVAAIFGLFQFLMVWLGSYGGYLFSFSSYGHLFQLVVAAIFLIIGSKILQQSFEFEENKLEWGFLPLLIMGFATSIDALAAGISLGTLPKPFLTSFEIGLITLGICGLAYGLSLFLKSLPTRWLLRLASAVFFSLGGRIIFGYFY
jgi:manganese efflux pump family protein